MFSTLNFAAFILYAVMLLWYILNSTSSFIGIITYSHKVFLCKLSSVKLRTYVYRLVYHTIILVCMRYMIQQIWVFENWKVLQYWNRRLNTNQACFIESFSHCTQGRLAAQQYRGLMKNYWYFMKKIRHWYEISVIFHEPTILLRGEPALCAMTQ